jgi:Protein of unknown function (DUF1569)
MAVDTKLVAGRRLVHYANLSEFLADAESRAAEDCRTLGNWTLPQIFDHLTRSLRVAVEGTDACFPLPARLLLRPLRGRFFWRPMKPGFNVPPKLEQVLRPAEGLWLERAFEDVCDAVSRFQAAPRLAVHPAFGRLTPEEWRAISLRHAELHMSFVASPSGSLLYSITK